MSAGRPEDERRRSSDALLPRVRDIIPDGAAICPAEVKGELLKLNGVADRALFAVPSAEFGEQVVAYVQPQPDAELNSDAIRQTLCRTLASYKVPQTMVLIDAPSREASGNVFKRRLRDPHWEPAGRSV